MTFANRCLWGLSAFFVGEERVTNQFSGLVLAAKDRHEEAFLLTPHVGWVGFRGRRG
jgi:hypothetical protein